MNVWTGLESLCARLHRWAVTSLRCDIPEKRSWAAAALYSLIQVKVWRMNTWNEQTLNQQPRLWTSPSWCSGSFIGFSSRDLRTPCVAGGRKLGWTGCRDIFSIMPPCIGSRGFDQNTNSSARTANQKAGIKKKSVAQLLSSAPSTAPNIRNKRGQSGAKTTDGAWGGAWPGCGARTHRSPIPCVRTADVKARARSTSTPPTPTLCLSSPFTKPAATTQRLGYYYWCSEHQSPQTLK